MKKQLLFLGLGLLSVQIAMAQSTLIKKSLMTPAVKEKPVLDFTPSQNGVAVPSAPTLSFRAQQADVIGNTYYDLQTNGSLGRRLTGTADGNLSGVFTFSAEVSGYTDRGTGYNSATAGAGTWGSTLPTARIEAERTGWPSIGRIADGSEVVVSHKSTSRINVAKNNSGQWVHTEIPTTVAAGELWPRMAVGGPNGNTLHVIAVTTPVANGGSVHAGVDGHVLYYRSLDGGATWDKQDVVLEGIDSTVYKAGNADGYFIDANGSTVAIGVFGDFGDVRILKSTDNGNNWTTFIANDFPIDGYVTDQGYTFDQLDTMAFDTATYPDSLAILTSDNAGTVLVDNDGNVHAWWGMMFVLDADVTDATTSYFPATSGLAYWNEDMGNDSWMQIADVVDADGNGVFDLSSADAVPRYFFSLTSTPSASIDSEGNIIVSYTGLTENFVNTNANPNEQNYNHIYMIASQDGGSSWSEPVDLITEETIEPDIAAFTEAVFGTTSKAVGNFVYIIFQADIEPGLAVRGDTDPGENNFIYSLGVLKSELGIVVNTEDLVTPQELKFQVNPNPATDRAIIGFEVLEKAPVSILVTNMMGQSMIQNSYDSLLLGQHQRNLDISQLTPGMYFVSLKVGNKMTTQKLMVR